MGSHSPAALHLCFCTTVRTVKSWLGFPIESTQEQRSHNPHQVLQADVLMWPRSITPLPHVAALSQPSYCLRQ